MVRLAREQERGAVLALLAIFTFIFLTVAALAVDLSALERRGQTLQNTADAAALAGVATWIDTADYARTLATVNDMLAQNGVAGDDILVEVVPSAGEVQVIITDDKPDVFLGSVVGFGGEISRSASARLEDCQIGCNTIVPLPEPFPPTPVVGSGDGYYPVSVGNRLYAINHGGKEIACVDRTPNDGDEVSACWENRLAHNYTDPRTGPVAHTVAVGPKLFWVAQEFDQLRLYCWQTLSESPCDTSVQVAALYRAEDLGHNFQTRGGGVVAVGRRIFVFTDDHRVHCFNSETVSRCGGYAGGLPTGMANLGFLPLDPANGVTGSNIDRVVNEVTGQIFHTLHIRDTPAAAAIGPTGVFVDCWDTQTNNTCAGFTPHKIHETVQRQSGRLFLHRQANGFPDGVCSTGLGDVQCMDLFGTESVTFENELSSLQSALPSADQYTNGMGVHFYHAESNRLILTSPRQLSTIHCWDFTDAAYCGNLYGFAGGPTEDYGFVSEGSCLYGLGHTSIFWAFTADMTPGCPGATAEVEIEKCNCGGVERWGQVSFNFDIGEDSPFTVLNVQVRDEDNNIIFPTDGSLWEQMVGRPSDIINLIGIPTTYETITLRVYLESEGAPFEAEEPPSLLFGFREVPYLTE